MKLITPVIVRVSRNGEAVDRLVKHCRDLDGTNLRVIPLTEEDDASFRIEYPANEKACRAAFSLRHAALAMIGKPFIWLEPDAIPLRAGWVRAISDEYARVGKPFLLSSDTHPPFDLVGGIGVYPDDTHWMVPCNNAPIPGSPCGSGWDLWLIRTVAPLVGYTPLIQHSYGIYGAQGSHTLHRFPRDSAMLRPGAFIFHKDGSQDLLDARNRFSPPIEPVTFCHAGDLGDVIYHLEVVRRMGGGHMRLCPLANYAYHSHCREEMNPARASVIAPLLAAQPYIDSVAHHGGQPPDTWFNLNRFRETFRGRKDSACASLQRAALRRFGLPPQDETVPWLTVPGRVKSLEGRIVVARSARYHNALFPWGKIVSGHRKRITFVGLPDEHKEFSSEFGPVRFHPTPDLLELARAIASSSLFIGNQSSPYAIAEGLKHPAIQESWPTEPNCLFMRPNLLHLTTDEARILEFIEDYV